MAVLNGGLFMSLKPLDNVFKCPKQLYLNRLQQGEGSENNSEGSDNNEEEIYEEYTIDHVILCFGGLGVSHI